MWRKSGYKDEDLQKYFRLASTYKTKFLQLRDAYLKLDDENEKLSNVLADTQNKMLSRINELKTELAELQLVKERLDSDLSHKLTAEQEAHLRIEGKLKREISQLTAKHQEELNLVKSSAHATCRQEVKALEDKLTAAEADLKLTRQNLNRSLTNYELTMASAKEKDSNYEQVKSKLDKCFFVLRYIETSFFADQPDGSPFRKFLTSLDLGDQDGDAFNWLVVADDCFDDKLYPVDSEIIKQIHSKFKADKFDQDKEAKDFEQSQSIQRILELTEELDLTTTALSESQEEIAKMTVSYEQKLSDLETKLEQAQRQKEREPASPVKDQEFQILRAKLELCESENLSLMSKLKTAKIEHEKLVKSLKQDFQAEMNALKESKVQQQNLSSKKCDQDEVGHVRTEMEKKIRDEQERFIKMLDDKDKYYEMVIGELESQLQQKQSLTTLSDLNNNSEKSVYQEADTEQNEAKLDELAKEITRLNDLLEERENMIEILQVKMDDSELEMKKKLDESQKSIENLRESQTKLLEELERSRASPKCEPRTNLSRLMSTSFQSISLMSDGKYLEATEIDYLKSIILGYMTGNDRLTMAKVIAAVLKFSDEEKEQVIKIEKSAKSSFWF